MSKVHVKTGDTVIVISGKDKGKKGQVMAVSPKEGKVIVEKVNMVSKHVKPRKMGEQGGIIKALCTLPRFRSTAPAAKSPQELLIRSMRTAPRAESAPSAARRFKEEVRNGKTEGLLH